MFKCLDTRQILNVDIPVQVRLSSRVNFSNCCCLWNAFHMMTYVLMRKSRLFCVSKETLFKPNETKWSQNDEKKMMKKKITKCVVWN